MVKLLSLWLKTHRGDEAVLIVAAKQPTHRFAHDEVRIAMTAHVVRLLATSPSRRAFSERVSVLCAARLLTDSQVVTLSVLWLRSAQSPNVASTSTLDIPMTDEIFMLPCLDADTEPRMPPRGAFRLIAQSPSGIKRVTVKSDTREGKD